MGRLSRGACTRVGRDGVELAFCATSLRHDYEEFYDPVLIEVVASDAASTRYRFETCDARFSEKWFYAFVAAFAALPEWRTQFLLRSAAPIPAPLPVVAVLASLEQAGCQVRSWSLSRPAGSARGAHLYLHRDGAALPLALRHALSGALARLVATGRTLRMEPMVGQDDAAGACFWRALADWFAGDFDPGGARYRYDHVRPVAPLQLPPVPPLTVAELARLDRRTGWQHLRDLKIGRDCYSARPLEELRAQADSAALEASATIEDRAQCASFLRWCARGLSPELAIKKLEHDVERTQHIAAQRRGRLRP